MVPRPHLLTHHLYVSPRASVTYVLLFIALLAQPHVLQGHVLFLTSAWAQSLATLLILAAAAATYFLHRAGLRRADRRNAALQEEKQLANEKLLDSFRYIGTVNRRLPLLQEVTSDVLRETAPTSRGRREAIQRLLALAVTTTARAPWGVLRFVDRGSGRTLGEHCLSRPGSTVPRAPIGNADLLALEFSPDQAGDPRALAVRWSSDRWASHQTYLILGPHAGKGVDAETLQSLLDQAHVLFVYFSSPPSAVSPILSEATRPRDVPARPAARAFSS